MTRVYGCSDDLVIIEHADGRVEEIDCYDKDVRILFEDDTGIRVGYPKPGFAVWYFEAERWGSADSYVKRCWHEDADPYSDVFVIESDVVAYVVTEKEQIS